MAWNIDVPTAEYYDIEHRSGGWTTGPIEHIINEIAATPEVAIDTETTGLVKHRDIPLYWSLGWGQRRCTIHARALPLFQKIFAQRDRRWFFANAKYDMHILANVGINLAGDCADTAVMHALLYEDRSHSLKDMVDHILGWRWSDFQDTFGRINKQQSPRQLMEKAERENFGLLIEYAADDAWGTICLARELKKQLEAAYTDSLFSNRAPYINTLWDLYDKTEVPYTKVLYTCERNGILVNREYLESIAPDAQKEIDDLARTVVSETNGLVMNMNSTAQLLAYFQQIGAPLTKKTKGGKTGVRKLSLDAEVLEHLAGTYPVAGKTLRFRELTKLKGTYIDGIQEILDQHGRGHTNFNQDVARTGRLSSSDPNFQNVPKPENDKWKLRGAFVAPPGMDLIVADYCVAPNTRILTSDLRWVPAINVEVGDDLIGFDEQLSKDTRYRYSRVVAKKTLTKRCYRVTMSNGAVLESSHDHSWVVGGGGRTWKRRFRSWVQTDQLEVGDQIAFFCSPWDTYDTKDAGYVSGILDGEGHCSRSGKVGFSQKPNACLRESERILSAFGISYARRNRPSDDVQAVEFYGSNGGLRVLGMFRPPRLMEKAEHLWLGRRTWSAHTERVYVTKIEEVGERTVIALETSSKTFIAEGFLSHNCQLEMRLLADGSREPGMIEVIKRGWDIHMGNAAMIYGLPYEEIEAAKKTEKKVKAGDLPESAMTERVDYLLRCRAEIKNIGFGLVYGMGDSKLARDLGITKAEATKKSLNFMAKYPAVASFKAEMIRDAEKYGAVYTIMGRRRSTPGIHSYRNDDKSAAERIAVNTPIQGSAADTVRMAQITLHALDLEYRYGCRMLLQVHDELVFECPKETLTEAKAVIKDVMEHPFSNDLSVPLGVDIGSGPSWMHAK